MKVGDLKERVLDKLNKRIEVLVNARDIVNSINDNFIYVRDVWDTCIGKIGNKEECSEIVREVVKAMFIGIVNGVPSGNYDDIIFKTLERMFDSVGIEVNGMMYYEWGLGEGLERMLLRAMFEMGLKEMIEPIEWLEKCIYAFPHNKCADEFSDYVYAFEVRSKAGKQYE